MPKIDLSQIKPRSGSIYPAPHDAEMAGRSDIDLKVTKDAAGFAFTRKDGTPYMGDDK